MSYKESLPRDFPGDLFKSAYSLEHFGIVELAWKWLEAIKVVEFLCKKNCAVLGGDVYSLVDGELTSTYDSWYINKDKSQSWHEFVNESKIKAVSYIESYQVRNGEDFYCSIIFESGA